MRTYEKEKECIRILDTSSFNPIHILECGQVFCYDKQGEEFICYPENKFAKIVKEKNEYIIQTKTPEFFVRYFDLDNDYCRIKEALSKNKIMEKPINFGYGIRILNQNLFETLISFIISANNNIKRIKKILRALREILGEKTEYGYSFPVYERMIEKDEDFYKSIGAGYRAKYIVKVLRQVNEKELESWKVLPTKQLRKNLVALAGVGPKVADCILLFGYHREDVFPVDTWIEQMYNCHFPPLQNREKISQNLVKLFGPLSGYAQQYLFYYQRSFVR